MRKVETVDRQAAINDFVLTSGYLIAIELGGDRLIRDYNKGFRLAFRPATEARGQPLSGLLDAEGASNIEIVPGLSGGHPLPHRLRTWSGQEVLLHAYSLADNGVLLLGTVITPDESLAVQRMSGLTTEMGNLVRELGRANRRILELSRQDALTGLANRRYFFERLGEAVSHAERHQHPLSVLMFDLDHFKQVNDTFGHAGGDAVLKAVSGLLRDGARAGDVAARLGGEELALLLAETGCDQSRQVAERFRVGVAALRPLGEEHVFTASIGAATLCLGEDGDALLARADKALYAAKEAGRNRVVVAESVAALTTVAAARGACA